MSVTPAIFAYSMLYPYSDNFLDDAAVPRERKLSFSAQLRRRLAGENLPPSDSREETIWKLVALIESGFARAEYPDGRAGFSHAAELAIFMKAQAKTPNATYIFSLWWGPAFEGRSN